MRPSNVIISSLFGAVCSAEVVDRKQLAYAPTPEGTWTVPKVQGKTTLLDFINSRSDLTTLAKLLKEPAGELSTPPPPTMSILTPPRLHDGIRHRSWLGLYLLRPFERGFQQYRPIFRHLRRDGQGKMVARQPPAAPLHSQHKGRQLDLQHDEDALADGNVPLHRHAGRRRNSNVEWRFQGHRV